MARLGPGKFENSGALGVLFYAIAGEGWTDEEAGDVSEFGRWYGLVRGPFILGDLARNFPKEWSELDAEDHATLRHAVGAIITEDTQGFVDIETYTSLKKLNKVWAAIEAEVAEFFEAEAG